MLFTISTFLQATIMVMLTGIKAFEARWQSLQATYPISAPQKRLVTQAMGRLVDNYATQEEIEADLPAALQILFNRLVDAYLNGCWIDDLQPDQTIHQQNDQRPAPTLTPAMLAAAQRRQQKCYQPTETSEVDTYIVDDDTASTIRRIQSRAAYV